MQTPSVLHQEQSVDVPNAPLSITNTMEEHNDQQRTHSGQNESLEEYADGWDDIDDLENFDDDNDNSGDDDNDDDAPDNNIQTLGATIGNDCIDDCPDEKSNAILHHVSSSPEKEENNQNNLLGSTTTVTDDDLDSIQRRSPSTVVAKNFQQERQILNGDGALSAIQTPTEDGIHHQETILEIEKVSETHEKHSPTIESNIPGENTRKGKSSEGPHTTSDVVPEKETNEDNGTKDDILDGWEDETSDILLDDDDNNDDNDDDDSNNDEHKRQPEHIDTPSSPYPNESPELTTANPISASENENLAVANTAAPLNENKVVEQTDSTHERSALTTSTDRQFLDHILSHPHYSTNNYQDSVVTRLTPDGIPVQINYDKLLKREISKRLLLERRTNVMKETLESARAEDEKVREAEKRSYDAKINDLLAEVSTLKDTNTQQQKTIDELKTECISLKKEDEEATTQMDVLQTAVESNHKKKSRKSNNNKEKNKKSRAVLMKELTKEVIMMHTINEELSTNAEKLASELKTSISEKRIIESELNALKVAAEGIIGDENSHASRVEELKSKLSTLQESNDHLKQTVDGFMTECRDLRSEREEMAFEIDMLRKRTTAEKHSGEEKDEEDKNEDTCEMQQQPNAEVMRTELKDKQEQLEKSLSEASELKKYLQKAEEQISNLTAQSTDELDTRQAEIASLRGEIKSLQAQNKKMEASRDEQVTEMREEIATLKRQNNNSGLERGSVDLGTRVDDGLSKTHDNEAEKQQLDENTVSEMDEMNLMSSSAQQSTPTYYEEKAKLRDEKASAAQNGENTSNESILRLTQEKNDLTVKLEEENHRTEELLIKVDSAEKERETFEANITQLQGTTDEVQQELALIRSEKEVIVAQCRELDEQLDKTKKHHLDTKANFEEKIQTLTEQNLSVIAESDELRTQCRESDDQRKEAVSISKALEEDVATLEAEKRNLAERQNELETKCSDLEEKIGEKDTIIRKSEESIVAMEKKVSTLQKEITDLSREKDELGDNMRKALAEREELQDEVKCLKSSADTNEGEIQNCRSIIIQLRLDLSHLKDQKDQLSSDFGEQLIQTTQQIEALTKEKTELVSERNRLLAQAEREEADRTKNATMTNEIRSRCCDLQEKNTKLEADTEQSRNDLESLREEIASLIEERDLLENENEEALAELGLLQRTQQNERELYDSNVESLEQQIRELEMEVSNAKDAVPTKEEEEEESLMERIENLTKENEQLLNAADVSAQALASKDEKVTNLLGEIKKLNRQQQQQQQQSSKNENQSQKISEMEQTIEASNRLIDELKGKFDEMEKLRDELVESTKLKDCRISQLELEVSQRNEPLVNGNKKHHMDDLIKQLSAKEEEILQLTVQKHSVDSILAETKKQLDLERREMKISEIGHSGVSSNDMPDVQKSLEEWKQTIHSRDERIVELRKKITRLEADLGTKEFAVNATTTKLEYIEQKLASAELRYRGELKNKSKATEKMTVAIMEKEKKLLQNDARMDEIRSELERCQKDLESRDTEISRLLTLLKATVDCGKSSSDPATDILDAASPKEEEEETESPEYMREQIVALATALERSEMERAAAMERIVQERKANSESLHKLSESVKRFYCTLSYSEP